MFLRAHASTRKRSDRRHKSRNPRWSQQENQRPIQRTHYQSGAYSIKQLPLQTTVTMNTGTNSTTSRFSTINSTVGGVGQGQSSYFIYDNGWSRLNYDNVQRFESREMKEASKFLSEFDETVSHLEKVEQGSGGRKLDTVKAGYQKEDFVDIEECLMNAKLDKRQKQALFIMVLCFDAEMPATLFDKLCKSQTMKAMFGEVFNDESIKLLTDLA